MDKTKSVFLQDALEVIDRSSKAEEEGRFLYHELITPYLLNQAHPENDIVLKYVGNIVIPGRHVKSIKMDSRLQEAYDRYETKYIEKALAEKSSGVKL